MGLSAKALLKQIVSRAFFALVPRFGLDAKYRDRMAQALLPVLQRYARTNAYYRLWEANGFHLFRHHCFEPIPDTRDLPEELWAVPAECPELEWAADAQLDFLDQVLPQYLPECRFPIQPTSDPYEFHLGNGAFEAVDAEVLHTFVRHYRPRQMIEVGGGNSTLVSARACQMNAADGHESQLVTVEPYPSELLKGGVPGLDDLIVGQLEDVDLGLFDQLGRDDILFIDSTHVVRIGGDVNRLFFDILPRLAEGVLVHFHDIYLPEEYPKTFVLDSHWFWTEQYLLRAFLMHNSDWEILWAGNWMRLSHPDRLARTIESFEPERTIPASFWIRKRG